MTTLGGHDSTGTYDVIARIITAGDEARDLRARTALATMRRYERRLVREAAIMGYVLGHEAGRYAPQFPAPGTRVIPPDHEIVVNVIQHCDSTGDRFPYIADACNGRRRRITRARLFHPEEPR